jgi:hypothetical protein
VQGEFDATALTAFLPFSHNSYAQPLFAAGILTLGVLPESTMVPLSLIVCSCNTIEAPTGLLDPEPPDTDAAAAADQAGSDPTTQAQTQTQAAAPTQGSKRHRGVNRWAVVWWGTLQNTCQHRVCLWWTENLCRLGGCLPGCNMSMHNP